MLTVYGIKQCDTCRKALKWLTAKGIDHQFHDFRVDGLQAELLQGWLESTFAGKLVNRRSTTWRQLSEEQRQSEGEALLESADGTPDTDQTTGVCHGSDYRRRLQPGTGSSAEYKL